MRKPDAWCLLKENEDIMVLVRSKERAEAWHADYPELPLYPLFRRTPEDRETLLRVATTLEGYGIAAYSFAHLRELAAKLREMAGDAP